MCKIHAFILKYLQSIVIQTILFDDTHSIKATEESMYMPLV